LPGRAEENHEKYTYDSRESGPRIRTELTEHMPQQFKEFWLDVRQKRKYKYTVLHPDYQGNRTY
jgi:hypothetical protein